ncbi:MAG: molybdopterin-dependent oxidoreductase, partial [Propionibacteriaceae bacterium]|nr:molybdopterin-dependent oxidoreductase [Propionibacteriaceae bacterium]
FLIELDPTSDGSFRPGKFLTAEALPDLMHQPNSAFKPVLLDTGGAKPRVVVPPGTIGDRWGEAGIGHWNLDLGDIMPALSLDGLASATCSVQLPRFDQPDHGDAGGVLRRGVPVMDVAGHTVTTVFDLLLAAYGVGRPGLPGDWPESFDDPTEVGTPAWAARITGVSASQIIDVARQFARNAEETGGRSMIILGAGTNHWFHSDSIYRTFITLLTLCGCQGVNGGGWAHYVGQEKARPITGQQHIGFALDWARPPRHMAGTSFWYLHSDQWRYDLFGADDLAATAGPGAAAGSSLADRLAQAVRWGWTPGHPGFNRNPLDLADEAQAVGQPLTAYVVDQLKAKKLRLAVEDPDDPSNFPRVLTLWRANLLGNTAKGSEYFLRHLLGTDDAVTAPELPPERRPRELVWREDAPQGKLDLITTVDFRMTGSALLSDIVLPAATWYEKSDISTTDMHPFVHTFNPAIAPPFEARADFQVFNDLADRVSDLAKTHLGTRTDLSPIPLLTDTPDELAQPHGTVDDWATSAVTPQPGRNCPKLVPVERDYTQIGYKMRHLGPLIAELGTTTKGVQVPGAGLVEGLAVTNGRDSLGNVELDTDIKLADAILALSGTTNGQASQLGFQALETRTGQTLADLSEEDAHRRITFGDAAPGPTPVFTSPEWSGSEKDGRRYSPFTINVERLRPWSTLTGRQQFYIDHDWMAEFGEQLPVFRPPLDMISYRERAHLIDPGEGPGVTVRYLTPHDKWAIHSSYGDNPYMLSLSRGGPTIWMSPVDAAAIEVADNDWVEAVNPHGVVVARAIVSHRMPSGTVYMYHAKDRTIDVPVAEASGGRGGIHNALTRIYLKPTHLIGGYAQLSYGFNYYGPTGNQRDEVTTIRRRSQEVTY